MVHETRQPNQNQMKEEPNRHLVCFFHSAILLVDQTITSASHLTRLLQKHHCELLHLQAPRPPLSSLRLRQESSSACLQAMPRLSTRCVSLLSCCSSSRVEERPLQHGTRAAAERVVRGCAASRSSSSASPQSKKRPPRPAVPAKSAASRRWRD